MSLNNVIKVTDLEIKYDKTTILKDINLNINKGEIVGFLGPSGSGKTSIKRASPPSNNILKYFPNSRSKAIKAVADRS